MKIEKNKKQQKDTLYDDDEKIISSFKTKKIMAIKNFDDYKEKSSIDIKLDYQTEQNFYTVDSNKITTHINCEILAKKNFQNKFPQNEQQKDKNAKIQNSKSIDIIVILDQSGSMQQDNKIEYAKDTLIQIINDLNQNDRICIIIFNKTAQRFNKLQLMNEKNKQQLIQQIQTQIQAGGGTDFMSAFTECIRVIKDKKYSNQILSILFLTDGNDPNKDVEVQIYQLFQQKKLKINFNINIFGYGLDINSQLLRNLAQKFQGQFYYIQSPSEIQLCFNDCLNNIKSVVVSDIYFYFTLFEKKGIKNQSEQQSYNKNEQNYISQNMQEIVFKQKINLSEKSENQINSTENKMQMEEQIIDNQDIYNQQQSDYIQSVQQKIESKVKNFYQAKYDTIDEQNQEDDPIIIKQYQHFIPYLRNGISRNLTIEIQISNIDNQLCQKIDKDFELNIGEIELYFDTSIDDIADLRFLLKRDLSLKIKNRQNNKNDDQFYQQQGPLLNIQCQENIFRNQFVHLLEQVSKNNYHGEFEMSVKKLNEFKQQLLEVQVKGDLIFQILFDVEQHLKLCDQVNFSQGTNHIIQDQAHSYQNEMSSSQSVRTVSNNLFKNNLQGYANKISNNYK